MLEKAVTYILNNKLFVVLFILHSDNGRKFSNGPHADQLENVLANTEDRSYLTSLLTNTV